MATYLTCSWRIACSQEIPSSWKVPVLYSATGKAPRPAPRKRRGQPKRGPEGPRIVLKERLAASSLRTVLGTGLLPVGHPLRVEDAADNVVSHAGQVAHTTTAHQHDGVLLQIVTFARDIGC